MQNILDKLSGNKTYLLMGALLLLTVLTHGDAGSLDLNAMVTDPALIEKEIGVLLIGSFRSAIAKVTS